LDKGLLRAQKSFFVGIQYGYQRHFRQVQSFAQKIDADQNIKFATSQIAQNLYPLKRFNIRMQVTNAHTDFGKVLRQILRHPLGQSCYQNTLMLFRALATLFEQMVDLPFYRMNFHFRIK
jgi:hypothetical protein